MQVKIYEKEKEKKGDKKVSQAQGRVHTSQVLMTVDAGMVGPCCAGGTAHT